MRSSRTIFHREKNRTPTPPARAEELNLRYNTHYIAPNAATVLVGVLSLLLGAMVTFIVVLAPLYAVAHAWGWLLRWQEVLVPSGPHAASAAVTALGWWLPPVIVAVITLALFVFWWLTLAPVARRAGGRARLLGSLRPDDPDRGADRAAWVGWAAAVTAGLAVAMLAVPPLISWLTRARDRWARSPISSASAGSRPGRPRRWPAWSPR